REGLLDAALSASNEVRERLGERSLGNEKLERATTTSLEALRAFSVGMAQVNAFKWADAASLLEEATLLDPRFATAHIYAAHCYSNLNQPEKAAPHFQAAFRFAAEASQRERLFILGSYYQRFLNDDRQAMEAYTALINLYPDDHWGVRNLAGVYERQ